jgi:hypothetical protein
MSVGFSKQKNPAAVPEHHLWTLRKPDGRTVEARTRMTPLGPELRIYYKGDFLRSQIPRDGRAVGELADHAERDWRARGWT